MEDRFGSCLAFTLREEGGYVDDPADPGRRRRQHGDHLGELLGMIRRPPSWRPPGQGLDVEDSQSDLPIALLEPAAGRRASAGHRSQQHRGLSIAHPAVPVRRGRDARHPKI